MPPSLVRDTHVSDAQSSRILVLAAYSEIRLSDTQTISFRVKLRNAKMLRHTLRLLQMGMIRITRVLIFLEVFGLEPAVLQTYSKTL